MFQIKIEKYIKRMKERNLGSSLSLTFSLYLNLIVHLLFFLRHYISILISLNICPNLSLSVYVHTCLHLHPHLSLPISLFSLSPSLFLYLPPSLPFPNLTYPKTPMALSTYLISSQLLLYQNNPR